MMVTVVLVVTQSANIIGGTVTGNAVSGAAFVMNIDGAGTSAQPINVYGNQLSGFTPNVDFLCGKTFAGEFISVFPLRLLCQLLDSE